MLVNHSEGRFYHRNGNFGAEEKLINMLEIKSIQRRNRKMLFWINESSSLDSQSLELRFLFLRNITIAFIAIRFPFFRGNVAQMVVPFFPENTASMNIHFYES